MTTGEAARRLGLSVSTVRWYANQGKVRVTRDAGNRRQLDPEDVEWLRRGLLAQRSTVRACWSCGVDIPQHRRYCAKPACQRRRGRQRQQAWYARQHERGA